MAGGDAQLAELEEWIGSEDAQQSARRALQGRGLTGIESDDLLNQTYLRVASRIQRRGPVELEDGKTVAAYAATAMRNIVLDMIRGRRKDGLGHVDRPPVEDSTPLLEKLGDASKIDVEALVVGRLGDEETIDALRVHLLACIDGQVWPESAALSLVTLAIDPERDDDLAPRPEAGTDSLRRYWTALWLAGCSDVLPQRHKQDGDDAARRKRRERAITKVKERIRAAHAAVAEGGGSR
jgi:DNA-directed RNA polymerase specialized sigma24 family protein